MEKELQGLDKGSEAIIHLESLSIEKKLPNLETLGHDGIQEFWFLTFTSIHDSLILELSRY